MSNRQNEKNVEEILVLSNCVAATKLRSTLDRDPLGLRAKQQCRITLKALKFGAGNEIRIR
ncbi:MAG: hypothetical protein CMP20_04735 [Rickettsiales bacterium]|jgi:hypothetical protein|nr:hypothetical protein [Rickettsiales bacterium]